MSDVCKYCGGEQAIVEYNNGGRLRGFTSGSTIAFGQSDRCRIRELETEVARLKQYERIVTLIHAFRQKEGSAVNIGNPNPYWTGPAQAVTFFRGFEDDDGTTIGSDPGIHGMTESLLNCLEKYEAMAAKQA